MFRVDYFIIYLLYFYMNYRVNNVNYPFTCYFFVER